MSKPGDIFPVRDSVKKTLFIPKLLLESTNFWPEKRSLLAKTTNWFMLAICVFIETGQIAFVVTNVNDITRIASAMSTISTTFQAITKMSALYFYSSKLKKVLGVIWYDFWPANIANAKTCKTLVLYNKLVITSEAVMFTCAFCFAFGFLSLPLRTGNRVLPFEAIYPFDWSKSPLYEIIYVVEWMTNIAFIIVGICGHDYLFVGICSNIIGQYIILSEIIKNLGTGNVAEINDQLEKVTKARWEKNEDDNSKLLKFCVVHHVVLAGVAKDIRDVFSFTSGVQLFSSVVALCMAALIMTFAEVDITLFTVVSSYMFGHLLQLFFFCTMGNELMYHANKFSEAISSSEWYNVDVVVQKDMLFVISRAQNEVKISAMGIKDLDYQTFIQVLRLSFSFYTMLSKVTST